MTGQELRNNIDQIRRSLADGSLSYDEAKVRAQPIIKLMNDKARDVANKFGKKASKFTFTSLMR